MLSFKTACFLTMLSFHCWATRHRASRWLAEQMTHTFISHIEEPFNLWLVERKALSWTLPVRTYAVYQGSPNDPDRCPLVCRSGPHRQLRSSGGAGPENTSHSIVASSSQMLPSPVKHADVGAGLQRLRGPMEGREWYLDWNGI